MVLVPFILGVEPPLFVVPCCLLSVVLLKSPEDHRVSDLAADANPVWAEDVVK